MTTAACHACPDHHPAPLPARPIRPTRGDILDASTSSWPPSPRRPASGRPGRAPTGAKEAWRTATGPADLDIWCDDAGFAVLDATLSRFHCRSHPAGRPARPPAARVLRHRDPPGAGRRRPHPRRPHGRARPARACRAHPHRGRGRPRWRPSARRRRRCCRPLRPSAAARAHRRWRASRPGSRRVESRGARFPQRLPRPACAPSWASARARHRARSRRRRRPVHARPRCPPRPRRAVPAPEQPGRHLGQPAHRPPRRLPRGRARPAHHRLPRRPRRHRRVRQVHRRARDRRPADRAPDSARRPRTSAWRAATCPASASPGKLLGVAPAGDSAPATPAAPAPSRTHDVRLARPCDRPPHRRVVLRGRVPAALVARHPSRPPQRRRRHRRPLRLRPARVTVAGLDGIPRRRVPDAPSGRPRPARRARPHHPCPQARAHGCRSRLPSRTGSASSCAPARLVPRRSPWTRRGCPSSSTPSPPSCPPSSQSTAPHALTGGASRAPTPMSITPVPAPPRQTMAVVPPARSASHRRIVVESGAVGLALGLLVVLPWVAGGYVLLLDWVSGPSSTISPGLYGLSDNALDAMPWRLGIEAMRTVFGAQATSWLIVLLPFPIAAAGAAHLMRMGRLPSYAAAIAAVCTPVVVDRVMAGHVAYLLGIALLPWLLSSALNARTQQRWFSARTAGWYALAIAVSPHMAWLGGVVLLLVTLLPRMSVRDVVRLLLTGLAAAGIYAYAAVVVLSGVPTLSDRRRRPRGLRDARRPRRAPAHRADAARLLARLGQPGPTRSSGPAFWLLVAPSAPSSSWAWSAMLRQRQPARAARRRVHRRGRDPRVRHAGPLRLAVPVGVRHRPAVHHDARAGQVAGPRAARLHHRLRRRRPGPAVLRSRPRRPAPPPSGRGDAAAAGRAARTRLGPRRPRVDHRVPRPLGCRGRARSTRRPPACCSCPGTATSPSPSRRTARSRRRPPRSSPARCCRAAPSRSGRSARTPRRGSRPRWTSSSPPAVGPTSPHRSPTSASPTSASSRGPEDDRYAWLAQQPGLTQSSTTRPSPSTASRSLSRDWTGCAPAGPAQFTVLAGTPGTVIVPVEYSTGWELDGRARNRDPRGHDRLRGRRRRGADRLPARGRASRSASSPASSPSP